TAYLASELKTNVSLDHIDVTLFRGLKLKGLYVEDLKKDTLLYVPEVSVQFTGFSYKKQHLVVEKAILKNPRIKLTRYADTPGLNIDFILNYFRGTSTDTTAQPWDVKVKKVALNNAVFSYRDKRWNDTTIEMDYEDLLVSKLNLVATAIEPVGDTLKFHLDQLTGQEKCGFKLGSLTGNVLLSQNDFVIKNMKLITKASDVKGDVAFRFENWDDFSDFVTKVKMNASFQTSRVASEDVKYFAEELFGLNKTVSLKGDIKGTVANLKGKNLEIIYTPKCYFKGDVAMNGLPELEETFIDLMAKDLTLNKTDIETINTYPFTSGEKIQLPDNVTSLGLVKFKGKFTGFYTDFVAYGDATTDLGFFSSDVNLKIGDGAHPAEYSGSLITHQFDVGRLLRLNPDIGIISSKVKVKGYSLALNKLNTKLDGTISELVVKGYKYTGITVNGQVQQKLFKGSLNVTDPNADLDFIGTIDYSKTKPVFDFTADIRKAKLAVLNLVDRDSTANLSTHAELHFTGSKIDEMEGLVHFTNTDFIEFPKGISINNLLLRSTIINNYREMHLESDFADAEIKGNYQLSTVYKSALNVLSKYIPALPVTVVEKRPVKQTFTYSLNLKETRGVFDVVAPDLSILAGTKLNGEFDSQNGSFTMILSSEEIIYNGLRFGAVNFTGLTRDNNLNVQFTTDELQVNDSLIFRNVELSGITSRDSADISLIVANTDSSFSRINLDFDVQFLRTGYTTLKVVPKEFILERNAWTIDPENYILFDSTGILFSHFNLNTGQQEVRINGIASADTSGKLTVQLVNFNSEVINTILKIYKAEIGGIANGNIRFASMLSKPVIESDLQVSQFSWFGDTLGDADLKSVWNTTKGRIEVNGFVTRGGEKNISVNGAYIIKPKGDELDFDISLKKTYIKTFSPYLKGLFSNVTGIASGEFKLYGPLADPELTGEAHLQKAGFTVDYLNTSYSFSTDVALNEDEIAFNNVLVYDSKGNQAIAGGVITHDHLRDFYFDINIAAKKVQLLNTTAKDNELYYGVGYGTGNISISGYLDFLKIDIAMRTEKGTIINIPLDNPEEISQSSFVTFLKTDTMSHDINKDGYDLGGIELNMDFDVTTDAGIKLIFDDKIGDVIEGRGTGTLTMKVNDADGFLMFGNYYIDAGQYTFTLQNIFSKPFTIEKGSTISWTGDPYNADVDLTAVYSKLKVGLYDLLQDTSSNYTRPLPVELKLHLKEKLFNPVISFDIEVLNIDAATESRIKRYINTDEEKFKQAVSLLVLRRFSPPDELANKPTLNTSSAVGQNAYEFISQQLSQWASQISKNVDVNVNYNPGNNITQEELEVALRTSFFNNRFTVEGNVNAVNNNNGGAQSASSIAGDFSVEFQPLSKDGRVKFKAFNRSNNNSLITNLNSQYTQGIGVFYREEFNTFGELTRKWFRKSP
ncbi:MAG: translocation/assembly module TamB domain-containing protein, partial [Bacteroidota bacterium]